MPAAPPPIARFYTALQRRDGHALAAAYGKKAVFSDPIFPHLDAAQVGAMWRMLCQGGTDLQLAFEVLSDRPREASARWTARYTFRATGRRVVNVVVARMVFEHGLIVDHKDTFSFWRWSRQALGPVGLALGWSTPLQRSVQRSARLRLEEFIAKEGR